MGAFTHAHTGFESLSRHIGERSEGNFKINDMDSSCLVESRFVNNLIYSSKLYLIYFWLYLG